MADPHAGGGNGSALLDLRTLRATLAAAGGREKLDLLLSAPDPAALVPALPAHELYLALLEIGPEDAAEVVSLASPEQFKHFVDASCWPRRDAGPDPRKLMRWLTLARDGGGMMKDEARERFYAKLAGLDPELLALALRHNLKAHDLSEDDDPQLGEESSVYRSPEGKYVIEITGDYPLFKRLLDDLYANDPFVTTRMLEALRWDVPTELEESARRWREARLRDEGVPDLEEALAFFARPASKKGAPPAPAPSGPRVALEAVERRPLLERAAERLSGEERDRAEEGVVYACNAALVAQGVAFDDVQAVRRALADARALLSLGLELVSGGDEEQAARALAGQPSRTLFQAAMGELYRLQSRARTAAKALRLPQAQRATLLDPPLANLVDGLSQVPPLLALPASDASGERRVVERAPGSRLEVRVADLLLDEAEGVAALLAALDLAPAALGPLAEAAGVGATALHASDVLRARVACALAGRPFTLEGLPEAQAPKAEGFVAALALLLDEAGARAGTEGARRAAARLKSQA